VKPIASIALRPGYEISRIICGGWPARAVRLRAEISAGQHGWLAAVLSAMYIGYVDINI